MKTVKSRLFKKYLKRKQSWATFCLSLGWLNISEKKLLKVGKYKVEKVVSLWPNFHPNFPNIYKV